MTKALVEMHDGVLTIESESGVGTVVSLTLPLRAPEPAAGKASVDLAHAVALA